MIDIGVARPSAQGQAMISTATALTSAKPIAGGGPNSDHTTNVITAAAITPGTNQPETVSASAWIGARERCASATMWTICASKRVAADPLGAHDERPGAVDGAAGDLVARPLFDRQRLAGQHRLVDVAGAVEHDAVDRDFFARPHPQPVARDDPF